MTQPTERQLEAFKRFAVELPFVKDVKLVLLKGHILIEEQVRLLIDWHVRNPEALCEGWTMKKEDAQRLAIGMAVYCVRNTFLEDLHAGTVPSSKAGDYSDVKVVSPYGEIPWA